MEQIADLKKKNNFGKNEFRGKNMSQDMYTNKYNYKSI